MARKQTLLKRLIYMLRGGGGEAHDPGGGTDQVMDTGMPLRREWSTYEAHKQQLRQHEGSWVVIHGDRILGIRPTYEEALRLGYEQAGYVDFLAHQIAAAEPVHFLPPQPI